MMLSAGRPGGQPAVRVITMRACDAAIAAVAYCGVYGTLRGATRVPFRAPAALAKVSFARPSRKS
jgi:hypothetical protein